MDTTATIETYDTDHAERVVEFFARCHERDAAIRPVSEETWRAFASSDFNRGGRDFRIAVADGQMVGLLTGYRKEPDGAHDADIRHLQIIVAPRWRRRGLGRRLLGCAARLDPPGDAIVLRARPPGPWSAKRAFLEHFGFRRERCELHMELDAEVQPSDVAPSGDISLRPSTDASDHPALTRVHNAAYRESYGVPHATEQHFVAARRWPGAHITVAERGGEVVGYCHTLVEDDGTSFVESLAVDPRHQGGGIGRALLVRGMRILRADADGGSIELSVDETNEPARALYRSVGFEVVDRSEHFARDRAALLADGEV